MLPLTVVLCPDKFLVVVTVLIAMNKQDENQFMREKIYSGSQFMETQSTMVGRRGGRNSLWCGCGYGNLLTMSGSSNGERSVLAFCRLFPLALVVILGPQTIRWCYLRAGQVPLPLLDLLDSFTPLTTHTHFQRCVSKVVLNLVTLTVKLRHHTLHKLKVYFVHSVN